CWAVPGYRERFLAEPAEVLREAGLGLPRATRVRVVENTASLTYLLVPEGADRLPSPIAALLAAALPLAPERQLRLVQNAPGLLYVPLPLPPGQLMPGMQAGMETRIVREL
ncbi:MAG: nitrile hydratase subunit alpha, partial [Candidatus Eremiobacterota bacterium]